VPAAVARGIDHLRAMWRSEDRRLKTEDRRPKTEGRRPEEQPKEAAMQIRRMATIGLGAAVALGLGILERTPGGRRLSRQTAKRLSRLARYQSGRLDGVRYRLAGRTPDPEAADGVLADRIRSALGPLEHRLDIPRVHVMACGHEVTLHGEVDSLEQEAALVKAVYAVPGVQQVTSRLAVGLFAGDSRPSEGGVKRQESAGMRKVLGAAHGAGVGDGGERAAARSVLCTFAAILPEGERRHMVGHLPSDVRDMLSQQHTPPRRPIRRFDELSTAALPMLPPERRQTVVESVLGAVRELVPEEVDDVAAVLPDELRHVWKTAIPL
jgi:uncharacterized protein (DUF2267 family)